MAIDQWRHYLLHNEFVIHADQRSLIHLNERRLHTAWQQNIFTKLMGLRFSTTVGLRMAPLMPCLVGVLLLSFWLSHPLLMIGSSSWYSGMILILRLKNC